MITHEFDLDPPVTDVAPVTAATTGVMTETGSPAAVPTADAPSSRPWAARIAVLLALALGGAGLGAVLSAAPAGRDDAPPLSTSMVTLDVTLTDTPAVTLRLSMTNPGPVPVRVTRLLLDDAGASSSFALNAQIAPGAVQTADVTVRPACTTDAADGSDPTSAHVIEAGGSRLTVLLDGTLNRRSGLCALVDETLPRGWRSGMAGEDPHPDGQDLVLDVPGLDGLAVAGSPVQDNGVRTLSIYAGDRLLAAELSGATRLRLLGPVPCRDDDRSASVPMSIRILVRTGGRLDQDLIQVGPELAAWLVANC